MFLELVSFTKKDKLRDVPLYTNSEKREPVLEHYLRNPLRIDKVIF